MSEGDERSSRQRPEAVALGEAGRPELLPGEVRAAFPEWAVQRDWKTPTAFRQCPRGRATPDGLERYLRHLLPGTAFSRNSYARSVVVRAVLAPAGTAHAQAVLSVVGDAGEGAVKRWNHCVVVIDGDRYVHISGGQFFELAGAMGDQAAAVGSGEEFGGSIDDAVRHSGPARLP